MPEAPHVPLRCDVLLFVVTSTEKEQLRTAARELGLTFTRTEGRWFRYYNLGKLADSRVMAVQTEMGPFSYGGSAARAINAMIETGATGIISLGMAFGVDRERQPLGTLLVSKMLLPYDDREVVTKDGRVHVDYGGVTPHESKPALVQILEREAQMPEWNGRVSFGAVLTGGAKIRCTAYRNELVNNLSIHGEIVVGGEMEGVGMLATCDREQPTWVLVKGVPDYADEQRDTDVEHGREMACRNAARFVLKALLNPNL
jgi:nucleoside phosphorylase